MEADVSGPVETDPVLIIVSVISSHEEVRKLSVESLRSLFGEIGTESGEYPFDLSDYYEDEMGGNLSRRWYTFSRLECASLLPRWFIPAPQGVPAP